MALALRATLNLLSSVFGIGGPVIDTGLLLEDDSSFILLEDGSSILLQE